MANSITAQDVRTQSNPVRGDLAGVRTSANRCLRMGAKTDRATTIALVRQVMAECGLSQKAMALNAEISEAVLSDALNPNGTRNLAAEWIFDQEDAFVLCFVEKLMRARGLTPESKREIVAEQIGQLVKLLVEHAA